MFFGPRTFTFSLKAGIRFCVNKMAVNSTLFQTQGFFIVHKYVVSKEIFLIWPTLTSPGKVSFGISNGHCPLSSAVVLLSDDIAHEWLSGWQLGGHNYLWWNSDPTHEQFWNFPPNSRDYLKSKGNLATFFVLFKSKKMTTENIVLCMQTIFC